MSVETLLKTWEPHLIELRKKLILSLLIFACVAIVSMVYAQNLYQYLAMPLYQHLPSNGSLIAINVTAPLVTPLKLALISSLFFCMPYFLYQLWKFIAPGLYKNEKRLAFSLFFMSIILFYSGALFAYCLALPMIFKFLVAFVPEHVQFMPDISNYLTFSLRLLLAFGIAFQVPILVLLLIKSGITTAKQLSHYRPYVIVLAFILGMLLTPPDVISQIMLAFPMWLLFELGLVVSRYF